MLNLWYKNAIIYCVDAETFMDSGGDGVGDFAGLADRLDHLEMLGVNCVWLLPFYPTPNRDNGYDIIDFYNVDSRLGTLGDFVNFMHAARDRGMRVIIDLVANHTSIDHPWFQAARSSKDSPYRDWYVWSQDEPDNKEDGIVFPGVQEAVWSYDELAQAWYLHRFYDHQADLNIANPAVREEIQKIMGFWLELGVAGFRLDAVPFLVEFKGLPEERRPSWAPHAYLTELQRFISWRRAEAILLAEANITMDESSRYFGHGDRMNVVFNFPLNQKLFLALARRDAGPLDEFLRALPDIPATAQWATFLRNHDELDLGRLSEEERAETFEAFGPDENMQIYGRGLRRRLAPMFGGDLARLKMAYCLMFALPGTPMLWYGEEIGMGENLDLEERSAVRTPMQWSSARNADFSTAKAEEIVRPVVDCGPFAYEAVNVACQQYDAGSLLNHVRAVVRARRACPEIGWGDLQVLHAGAPGLLALLYEWRGNRVIVIHNLSGAQATVDLPEDVFTNPRLVLTDAPDAEHRLSPPLTIGPYGYLWARIGGERR